MESIIDCYFDNIFTQMDRGCLIPRYKRKQIVDYFSTVIRACNTDNEGHEQGCKKAVEAIIKFHKKAKDNNGSVCLLGKYHNVLYVALKLCFDWQLKDHMTVKTVLIDLFSCEKTFERLMIGAIFGTRVTHLISGWKSDFQSRDECLQAVEYFLKHAAKTNLKFEMGGKFKTMADITMPSYGFSTPAKVCIQAGKYDFLRVLLRFGAQPVIVTNHNQCPLHLLLLRMHTLAESAPGDHQNLLFRRGNGHLHGFTLEGQRNFRSNCVSVSAKPRNNESVFKQSINPQSNHEFALKEPTNPETGKFSSKEPMTPESDESSSKEPARSPESSESSPKEPRTPESDESSSKDPEKSSKSSESSPKEPRTPKSDETFSKESTNTLESSESSTKQQGTPESGDSPKVPRSPEDDHREAVSQVPRNNSESPSINPRSNHGSVFQQQRNLQNCEIVLSSPLFPEDLIKCLQVFMSVIPQVPHTIFDNENEPVSLHPFVFMVVPEDRNGGTAASLKHLCRCEIRKCLVINGCLPYGIYELKLPLELQKYIDMDDLLF